MRDQDLTKHLSAIQKAKPDRVRGELLRAGVALALDGQPRAALALFDAAAGFARHPHESIHYERGVAGLRFALGDKTAKKAAAEADELVRADLLIDRWEGMKKPAPKKGPPPAVLDADQRIEWFRRALLGDEKTRLAILQDFAARPDLPPYFRDDTLLLVADDLARAKDAGAGEAFDKWRAQADSFPERALALGALAKLLAGRDGTGLPKAKVDAFVKKATGAALAAGSSQPAASDTHEVTTLYNQLYLEPKKPKKHKKGYFEDPAEVKAGFALRGDAVALSTPTECESCSVTLRVGEPPAKIAGAKQVVRFPLQVTGDLYLRSASDTADDHRYEVPPGKYAVTAAWKKGKRAAGLDRYDVQVWLAAT